MFDFTPVFSMTTRRSPIPLPQFTSRHLHSWQRRRVRSSVIFLCDHTRVNDTPSKVRTPSPMDFVISPTIDRVVFLIFLSPLDLVPLRVFSGKSTASRSQNSWISPSSWPFFLYLSFSVHDTSRLHPLVYNPNPHLSQTSSSCNRSGGW